jgi:hypothetical protein
MTNTSVHMALMGMKVARGMSVVLPVVVQQEIKSYTQYALPLCVVFTEEKYHPWIYKEFIQIKSARKLYQHGDHLDYVLRKEEDLSFQHMYEEVMEIYFTPASELRGNKKRLSLFRESITSGYYIHLYMDEFYIKKKPYYQKSHFVHPSLLYGFDEKKDAFLAIGFIDI